MSISSTLPNASGTLPQSSSISRSSNYRASDEVRQRANVTEVNDTPRQQGAIKRLDQTMSAEAAPSKDVPRGYYLDILV